jgi:hypothetical protein
MRQHGESAMCEEWSENQEVSACRREREFALEKRIIVSCFLRIVCRCR